MLVGCGRCWQQQASTWPTWNCQQLQQQQRMQTRHLQQGQ
jgi:hypothetical protein